MELMKSGGFIDFVDEIIEIWGISLISLTKLMKSADCISFITGINEIWGFHLFHELNY